MGDGVVNSQKAPARSAKAGDVSTAGASDEKRSESQPSNASGISGSPFPQLSALAALTATTFVTLNAPRIATL